MRFSVIVPIYNVEKYLPKCIDSILCQTFSDFELILVDDGSPDNCPSICDYYAKRDDRIKVLHKKNGGLVSARNAGIEISSGDYICYVDGDDWIDNNLLEVVYKKGIANKIPEIVIFGAKRIFKDNEVVISSGLKEGLYLHSDMESILYPYMMYDNRKPFCKGLIFPVAWNKIYKREFLLDHYCKDERIRMGEDNAFIFECLFYAKKAYFCNDVLYNYNQLNTESMIHSYDPNRFHNNKLLTEYIENKLGGINCVIDSQINAFKAYWLIMAIFHEVKSNIPFIFAVKHIKSGIASTKCSESIKFEGLPFSAKLFIFLIKMKLYSSVIVFSKFVNSIRNFRSSLRSRIINGNKNKLI